MSLPARAGHILTMSKTACLIGSILALLVVFFPLTAYSATIYGEASDTDVRSDGTVSAVNGTSLIPGASGSPALDRSAVYVFLLPNLGAVANPFTSASFRFNLSGITGTPSNVDLYGLGRRTTSTVLASDYYGETSTADSSDAAFLQDNILISSTTTGVVSTSSGGSTALKNYLNTQYASGAGAGKYVFLRLSTNSAASSIARYTLTSADSGAVGPPDTRPQIIYNLPTGYTRPFIWVRDVEKAGIQSKITNNSWAASVYNGMISRVAADVASHQANRDSFLRGLPVDWTLATPKFKTIPAYSESSVRYPAEARFNDGVDCAVLYYLTGDTKYAQCAADILHNAVKTLLPVAPSTSVGNGGWIFQTDYLKESRVTGTQLPIIYDFLYSYLKTNQVYDVQTAGMVNFNFTNAQSVFRTLYQLARDHGSKNNNWSALMATTMLNNLLALDDATERNAALQVYLTTGSSHQASLDYDYRNYPNPGDIWPESLQYSGAVGSIRTSHMVLLERVDPNLDLFNPYPNLPLSLPRISQLRYPDTEQISFGDGHRDAGTQPFADYELVYQHALARGKTDLTSYFGPLINGGVSAGQYNRSSLNGYSSLGPHDEPLQLLWQSPSIPEAGASLTIPRTDALPYAGITLQRNPAPTNNSTYGLMCFVGGGAHTHSHASGMSMEIFGLGEVMGAKSGREDYGSTINENYYRVFASNNTVIVNGASRGEGGWGGFAINTVQNVAMEPQAFATAVSPDYSFTCSSFVDDKGTLAEGTQQRTMAIVRTSPTTGYYVDVFRSKSTVTNRTATTLNGDVTDQYHDYIYRNIGETTVDLRADGVTLPLTSQPDRFQNDIGDANEQPGWRYFENTKVSYPTGQSVKAQFVATVSGTSRYMDMHMPAVASREYAKVDSPPVVDAPSPYNTRSAPTLVVRQIGEAWNKAFATIYEPHFGSAGGTVQSVTELVKSGVVVGVKVESSIAGKTLVQYVISNSGSSDTYTDSSIGLTFKGRFGIVSDNGDGSTNLYLGSGSTLSYRGNSATTVSGSNSQAEVRFSPGRTPVVTSNTALTVVAAPSQAGGTWVPTTAGTFDWTHSANWNPAAIPNSVGGLAQQNINIAGDQTVNVNTAVTLGELVVGDSSGSQNTLLQKGTNGSITFDQKDAGLAYLTRTAGGTGTVTFNSDLNIALNDNLTVRLAGGTSNSTMVIAGTVSGSNKSLQKEGGSLTLSLSGANTYSGPTRVVEGILSLDHNLALQNSELDTLNFVTGSSTDGLRTTVTTLTLGGLTGDKNLASVFTTTSGGYARVTALTLNPEAGSTVDYSGVIANGAAGMTLTKSGAGTQILEGINTYNGETTVSANSGTLEIGGSGKLGSGTYAGAISIENGSIFKYSSSAPQTFSGSINGTGSLIKNTSSSSLTLSAANSSFTGSATVSAGTLVLGNTNALSGASAVTLTGTAAIKTSVQNATINAPINTSGSPTIHAPDFGTGSAVSTLTLGGAITGTGNLSFSSTSTVASNSNQTIRLNAQSSYSGSTTLNPADNDANLTLKLGITNALPTSTVLSINGAAGGGSGRNSLLDLNGFSQTIAGLKNTALSLRNQRIINSAATAATLTINNSGDYAFSGNINGSNISLVKSGTGTQSLSGANSYTGTTTINAGTLQGVVGGNCANSAVTLNNAAATCGVSITDNTKTWTCASLICGAAGSLEFEFGSIAPGSVSPLTVTGSTTFVASPTIRIITDTGLAAGTYPLMTWGSTSGTAPTIVTVLNSNGTGSLADGTLANLSVSGNNLNLVITSVPISTKANNSNNLNLGTSWVGGVAPDSATTARWNNTVTSANTTVLGADTTWAGISIVNPAGTVTINAGNTLTLGENTNDIEMGNASADLTLNCPLILGDANTWNVATGRTLTIVGVVSGSFSVTKDGAGSAVLSGANTYSGSTTLAANSGTLEIGGAGKLAGGAYAGAISIGSGSTFKFSSSAAQTLSGGMSGSGTLEKSTSTSTLTLSGSNTAFTGSVTLDAGTLVLGNSNALSSATAINLGSGTVVAPIVQYVSITAPIDLTGNATLRAPDFGSGSTVSTLTVGDVISGSASLTLGSTSSVANNSKQTILLNAQSSYTGGTTFNPAANNANLIVKLGTEDALPPTTVLSLTGVAAGGSGRFTRLELNGFDQTIAGLQNTVASLRTQQVYNTSSDPATLTINNSSNFTYSGLISGAGLGLIKSGAGTQTLSGANSHTGSTTVSSGILSLANSLAMQNSPLDTFDSVAGDAANGLRTTVTTLTLGGLTGDKNLASIFTTNSGGYSGVTDLTLNPDTGSTCDYSGVIANGAAGMTLTKSGLGTQILSGANTYTGATTVSVGSLSLTGNRTTAATGGFSVGNVTGKTGTLNVSNGTFTVGTSGSNFLVGSGTDSTGILNQTGGSLTTTGNQLLVGNLTATGIYNLSGGTLDTIAGSLGVTIGVNTGTTGIFNISGTGTLSMPAISTLQICRSDNSVASGVTGTFSQTGGTATIGILRMGGSNVTPANNADATATLNLSGGSFSVTTFGMLSGADNSTSTIHISGTADVTLPAFPTARGTNSTATITFDGGTLRNTAASTTYMGGLTNVYIKSGGATIDTTNGGITITQDILTDVVSTGGGLTKEGTNTLTLTGNNTFTGGVMINAGTLALGASHKITDGIASFTINDGIFNLGAYAEGITPAITLANGTIAGTSAGYLLARGGFAGTGTNTISQRLTVRAADSNSGLFNISSGTTTVSGAIYSDDSTVQGITKSGSGTLILTNTNTYSGDTTVSGGTLSLGANNTGNNSSTVTIASSGALLKLNFTGSDTVARLFIGTSQKPAGQYGHSSTGATNGGLGVGALDAFFAAGTGTLTVTSGSQPGGYSTWKTTNAPTGAVSDDYDGDGVANGVEYVLGGLVGIKDLDKLPKVSTSGGNLLFTFKRDQKSIDGSTSLTIETSSDINNWTTTYSVPDGAASNNPGVTVAKNTSPGFDTVTLTLPQATNSRKFAHLKVVP